MDTDMSQISNHYINPQVQNKITETFVNAIEKLHSASAIKSFFSHLLSPTEQIMLSKRLAIAYMLEKGYQHRTISSVLKVSTSTINRVSLVLKSSDRGYKPILHQLLKQESLVQFLEELDFKIAKALPPRGANWSQHLKNHLPKRRAF